VTHPRLRLTVVGDVLLDRDVVGTVDRVCPDAPAPVVDVIDEVLRPGGAGLAAALLAADGHRVRLLATVGDDPVGRTVADVLRRRGVELVALPTSGCTREKMRVRVSGQSLVRLDSGTATPPEGMPDSARSALSDCDAVLVSDYGGGVLASPEVRDAVAAAAKDRPVVWDPHVRGAEPVPGCRLVTPNSQEAAALAAAVSADTSALAAAGRDAELLRRRWQAAAVCVTLGARGALVGYGSGAPLIVPAETVERGDPCGAGDRFAASVTAALGAGSVVSDAVQEAVRSAGAFVAGGGAECFVTTASVGGVTTDVVPAGTAAPTVDQVRDAGGLVVATGGCFDLLHAGHVSLLSAARSLGDALVVCLNSDDSVARLKGPGRPLVPESDRARVLEALGCVDQVVVFDESTPDEALRRVRPDVWVKGGDYALTDLPEAAVVASWGGQTVILPYLDGRSTSSLIGAARTSSRNLTHAATAKEHS